VNKVKKKILVVDDDENICELFNDFLKREGHEPTTVRDGADALSLAQKSRWDLVFLDLSLPVLNGWDIIKSLRQIQPGIKVVITTGLPCEEEIRKVGENRGAIDFLQKPFLLNQITEIITRHCLNDNVTQ
jgi:DNA-binding response OmpR family regulator